MKDPDGVYESIRQAAGSEEERERLTDFAGHWLKYEEYVTLEFDTEAHTCEVVR